MTLSDTTPGDVVVMEGKVYRVTGGLGSDRLVREGETHEGEDMVVVACWGEIQIMPGKTACTVAVPARTRSKRQERAGEVDPLKGAV